MENYTQTCRFILSANYSSKIIEPIQSRCVVFRFKPLIKENIISLVKKIASSENLKIDDKTIETLYTISEGDLRKLENLLQSTSSVTNKITKKELEEIISFAQPKDVQEIINLALNKDFQNAKRKLLNTMLNQGLSGLDIIKEIQKQIINMEIEDNKKLEMIEQCGEIEFRLVEGSDEFVQLQSLLASFTRWCGQTNIYLN